MDLSSGYQAFPEQRPSRIHTHLVIFRWEGAVYRQVEKRLRGN